MKLTIPENISLEWELVRGIGKREILAMLKILLPALVLAVVLAKVLTAPTAPLALLMGYVLLCVSCYLFFARLDPYQSVYLFLRRGVQFRRQQQKYYYRHREEVLELENGQ